MINRQRTIKKPFKLSGIEALGGKSVYVYFEKAPVDNGIKFITPSGYIPASLDCVKSKTAFLDLARTLSLSNGRNDILVPEHLLGIVFGMELDNANIILETEESRSYSALKGILGSSNSDVVPYLGEALYDHLENNLEEQETPRKNLFLEHRIESDRLSIEPTDRKGIIIDIETDYKLRSGERVIQSYKGEITPELVKEISLARAYCRVPHWSPKTLTKFLSQFFYLSQGLGNGSNKDNIFYPEKTANGWHAQERVEAEIVKHSILDKLGEIALLSGRLSRVKITSRGASHKHTMGFLQKYQDKFR